MFADWQAEDIALRGFNLMEEYEMLTFWCELLAVILLVLSGFETVYNCAGTLPKAFKTKMIWLAYSRYLYQRSFDHFDW